MSDNNNNNNNPSYPRDLSVNSTAAADDEYIARLLMTLREGSGGPSTAGPSNAAPAQRKPEPEQVLLWANIQQHIAARTPETPPISVICAICRAELVIPGLQELTCDREDHKVLSCGHVFGNDCVWAWIAGKYTAPGGVPCPICRKPMSREDVDASDDDDYPMSESDDGAPPPLPPQSVNFRHANPLQRIASVPQTLVPQTLASPPRSVPSQPPNPSRFPTSSVRTEAPAPAPARRPAVVSQSARLMRHYAAMRQQRPRSPEDSPTSSVPTSAPASAPAPVPARRPAVVSQSARLMRHYAARRQRRSRSPEARPRDEDMDMDDDVE
ncbi:hypothetical protein B0T18DRAFT_429952 [Schizothecium vesticola]|uniref:RING-type domain-containing protein n=1 Tax=Schizothecium vesticola TaxID=314040 RepID=A0AA40K5X5_9PEZI|nr:hypothetical protein B0T18DRAFT_429952 [Schizothecium vesticola]